MLIKTTKRKQLRGKIVLISTKRNRLIKPWQKLGRRPIRQLMRGKNGNKNVICYLFVSLMGFFNCNDT